MSTWTLGNDFLASIVIARKVKDGDTIVVKNPKNLRPVQDTIRLLGKKQVIVTCEND